MYKKHILVCESGWRKIRELSIKLAKQDIVSTVLIEGLVEPQVKAMITRHRGINNVFIPEGVFTPLLFIYLTVALVIYPKRKLAVYLSKERTYNRLSVFRKVSSRIELTMI